MTIKEFAELCGCNPQTLRYYDREGLLKPERVDRFSGYRHYAGEQALDFVRIRDLRKAGFSIGEIKELLDKDSESICEAVDKKIKEIEALLERARAVRMSYAGDIRDMKKRIEEFTKQIEEAMRAYSPEEEFGVSAEKYEKIMNGLAEMLRALPEKAEEFAADIPEDADVDFNGMEEVDFSDKKADPMYADVLERHGWNRMKEVFEDIADLEDGAGYMICVDTVEKKGMGFSNTLLALLLERNEGKKLRLELYTEVSKDGRNHLLLRKRR